MAAQTISISSPLPSSSSLRSVASNSYRVPNVSLCSNLRPSFPSSNIILKPLRTSRSRPRIVSAALTNLSETELVAVPTDPEEVPTKFPPDSGVYAVYDSNDELQFIGMSRNIAASVAGHRKALPELCCSVKAGVVDEPNRTALTQAWKSWMEEHIRTTGAVPLGNQSGNTTWVPARPQAPRTKADLRLTPGRHVSLTVPLEDLIDRLVKENKVVAFIKGSRSAPLCGFSQRVVGILESQGVDYETVDVLDEEYNYGLRETLKRYSNWPTFPQIFAGGELIGGCDILTSMYENGELGGLLKK